MLYVARRVKPEGWQWVTIPPGKCQEVRARGGNYLIEAEWSRHPSGTRRGREEQTVSRLSLPFFNELEQAGSILLAGAGGGFDVFSALPLYFGLREAGKRVHLANLSFSHLEAAIGRPFGPAGLEVTADSTVRTAYFPEFHLCRWFRRHGEEVPVYCFDRTGLRPLLESYRAVVAHLGADAVVLVDGGTDSLMRGDEAGLGTPEEDIARIAAVDELEVAGKYLVCLGFGVDAFHGVCHAHALEAVAELTRAGGFLGAFSLLREMPEVRRYEEATLAVFDAMPDFPSIVSASILSALEGHYGDHHRTARTRGSTLWINPLMTFYWCFRLEPVARRLLYLDEVKRTQDYWELMQAIDAFRKRCTAIRERAVLPDASFDRRVSR
jgi:hypothetical protein